LRLHHRCDLVCPDLPKVLRWCAACLPSDTASELPNDNIRERGLYSVVCIEAETGAFIAE